MVIALLGIIAFLLIYTSANIQTLNFLSREINAVQKAQVQRLKQSEMPSPSSVPVKRPLIARSVHHD